METHEKYPGKFENIVRDTAFLRQPAYDIDVNNEQEIAMACGLVEIMEELLYVDYTKGNTDGNLIGLGLAACQLRYVQDNQEIPTDLDAVPSSPTSMTSGNDDAPLQKKLCVTPLKNGRPPKFSIIRIPSRNPLALNMVNPVLVETGTVFGHKGEGCLSLPGMRVTTVRYRRVRLGFFDPVEKKPRELELYGLEAVAVQHEIDHLSGMLITDRVRQPRVAGTKVGPNDPCPCGKTGKDGRPLKYKKCCM